MPRRDLIDFPVSDLWRDHYAAQGLTYDSGRRTPHPYRQEQSSSPPPSDSGMTALLTLVREQELKIQALTAELLQLKQAQKNHHPNPHNEGIE